MNILLEKTKQNKNQPSKEQGRPEVQHRYMLFAYHKDGILSVWHVQNMKVFSQENYHNATGQCVCLYR